MTALANYAKYSGRYDEWITLRQRHGLKWSSSQSLQSFDKFFNEDLNYDTMLKAIKEMITKIPL